MKKYLLAIVLVFVGVYLLDGHCTTSRFKDSKSKKNNPDGTYDEQAKRIAEDFNNGGHPITINGITLKCQIMKRIIKIKKHPFGKNYLAINLFGFIFTLRDLDKIVII